MGEKLGPVEQLFRRIFVASKSKIKIDTVQSFFTDAEVIPIDSESGIPEQPLHFLQTLQGALNRLRTAREHGAEGWVTAIENGIMPGDELLDLGHTTDAVGADLNEADWYDASCVVIDDGEGHQGVSVSEGVVVPHSLMELVFAVGDQSKTMGKFLAERFPDINHQDPHAFLTNGMRNRVELMKGALQAAFKSLLNQRT